MIAGPNGSGKSTIKEVLSPNLLGVYVNADEIQCQLNESGSLDFSKFRVTLPDMLLTELLEYSSFAKSAKYGDQTVVGAVEDNKLAIDRVLDLPYLSSMLAEIIRSQLISQGESITFETVMSHPSKVQILNDSL